MTLGKGGKCRQSGVNHALGYSSRASTWAQCRSAGPIMFGMLLVMFFLGPSDIGDLLGPSPTSDDLFEVRAYKTITQFRGSSVNELTHRDTAFSFKPKVAKWDSKRTSWLRANNKTEGETRSHVMLVTGSQPYPCERPIDTHMLLKSAKNKVHYSRMHGIHMYYNLIEPQPDFTGGWAKLPVLRMLMLAHPEVEWFWWIDSDAVITDMELEIPLLNYERHNFVIHGDEQRVFGSKDWNGLLTGNFLIRNCDWSLRLLDAWGSMGPVMTRESVGRFLSGSLNGRPNELEADDQSALVYLLATEKQVWAPMLLFEKDLLFTTIWVEVTHKLEEMEFFPSGDSRLPVVTHFAGCSQCGSGKATVEWAWEDCEREMQRAMDFADNQMYQRFGYKLPKLGSPELVHVSDQVLESAVVASPFQPLGTYLGYAIHKLPGPFVTNWDEQRVQWFEKNPTVQKVNKYGQPKTMLVTGSSYSECSHPVGGHLLLQGLKNKVDYAHFHDMALFYGMLDFDPELNYWWTKIPTVRLLMVSHPEVEWFWWCDADAVITDMVFEVPFERFQDKNFILYGDVDLVEKRDWIAVNAGIYLLRNCQWSLDFLAIWASVGTKSVRKEAGLMQAEFFEGRGDREADDQSALIILIESDTEKKWTPQIALERQFSISGYWKIITNRFEEMKLKSQPGLGNMEWPWITHFAGCQPCGTVEGNFDFVECQSEMQRAFDFSDNQILPFYGLHHPVLGIREVTSV